MLVPVLGIVQVGEQVRADRYTYLPQVGLLIAAVWGMAAIPALARSPRLGALCGAAATAALSAATFVQVGHWRDSETLFRHSLAATAGDRRQSDSHGWMLHNNLGVALRAQGRNEEAAAAFREAIRIYPGYAFARNNLGNALAALGRFPEAEAEYRQALRIDPHYAHTRNNLGNALAAQGRFAEAEAEYREALRLQPDYPDARESLRRLLALPGNPAGEARLP
ncbi:MAG TPA: tetratricopeptide repeat protein [Candidatus Methanoperedens sp.]|nr:tetratricopeptide repeat protein [Candidatus Methanoperedens sp.]